MKLRTNLILRCGRLGSFAVLLLLLMATACGKGNVRAAASPPAPEVRVATVIQQDVPVYSEWVATLDGYANAEIRPQVSGYIIKQNYKEGSVVRKGQVLFEIDPRPFKAALDRAKGDLAQAQAQLGKSTLDVERDTPLAEARAIAKSQLDNEIQAKLGAQDQKWWEVFQDKELQDLIHTALQQNYDVRIAATRILQAQAQLGITRADQLPTVSAGAQAVNQRNPPSKFFSPYETNANQVDLSLAWELDFWGKYRRATESARATLLANQWAREAVVSTLVSDVATAYFELRALDLQLEISRRTLTSRQDSLQLTQTLANGGATSMLDVRQAEQLVDTAAETIPDLERRIEQQENFLSTLLGNNPGPIARGMKLTEQPHAPDVPAGLPSSLLERRPDIREAEAQLIAANAQIGVAKAAYFPQITLTAAAGYQSSALTSLFTGPAGLWSFGGSLVQPIFEGGRIRSGVKFSEARQQEMVLTYQQTIQQAFRGVSDALVEYHKDREFTEDQQQLALSAQDAARLSEMRYRGGATSYLEVLTNETNYFDAELGLAQAQSNELVALVRIYRNLGGGWQQ